VRDEGRPCGRSSRRLLDEFAGVAGKSRNGKRAKTVLTDASDVQVVVPSATTTPPSPDAAHLGPA